MLKIKQRPNETVYRAIEYTGNNIEDVQNFLLFTPHALANIESLMAHVLSVKDGYLVDNGKQVKLYSRAAFNNDFIIQTDETVESKACTTCDSFGCLCGKYTN